MCGRARCTLNPQQVAAACGLSPADAASVPTQQLDRYRPSYNVAPGANLPVLALRKDAAAAEGSAAAPVVRCMKWGLVPGFTKKTEKPDHYRMFNARSESVKEKASFRRLIPNNRCLVAVEGFYEWKKDGSKKQPYYIHFKDHQPLVFAALYDSWENAEGEILHTFTILTTQSSSALQWLHDRMPVILRDNSIDVWLSDSSPKLDLILKPYEDLDLVWYPVSPAMGKPSFNGIECIKEIQIKSGGEKPISKFFSKKNEDKSHEPEPEPEPTKSYEEIKQEDVVSTPEEEPDAGDYQEKVSKEEKKEAVEPETRGIKREHEEMAMYSSSTNKTSDDKPSRPMKKKEKSVKNQGDKQASLFSYFGRA